jgi:hypothetical protein
MAVDMACSFRQDDEQLEQLMREVGEDGRKSSEEADAKHWQAIRKEAAPIKKTAGS